MRPAASYQCCFDRNNLVFSPCRVNITPSSVVYSIKQHELSSGSRRSSGSSNGSEGRDNTNFKSKDSVLSGKSGMYYMCVCMCVCVFVFLFVCLFVFFPLGLYRNGG